MNNYIVRCLGAFWSSLLLALRSFLVNMVIQYLLGIYLRHLSNLGAILKAITLFLLVFNCDLIPRMSGICFVDSNIF